MEQCKQAENSNFSDSVAGTENTEIAKTSIEYGSTDTNLKDLLSAAILTCMPPNTTNVDVYEEEFVQRIPPPDTFTDLPQTSTNTEHLEKRYINSEKERISGLVHELIMEKYQSNLVDIKQRSFEVHTSLKKKIKNVNMRYDDQESMDSGLSHSGEDFADKDEAAIANGTEKSTEVEYDEHAFLVEALGEEMANMDYSVNSSTVSPF